MADTAIQTPPSRPAMERSEEYCETQREIDTMTLDYLVCDALNHLLNARLAEKHGQNYNVDVPNLLRLASTLQARIPAQTLESDGAGDIKVKLQLLSFAKSFIQTCRRRSGDDDLAAKEAMPLPRMRDQFMSIYRLADAMAPIERRSKALNFLARYLLQECLDRAKASGRPALGTFHYCVKEVPDEATTDPAWMSIREEYTQVLQPRAGVSPSEHLQHLLTKFSISKFEDSVIQFLFGLMDQLETPELYRLEWKSLRTFSPTESDQ